MKACNRLIGGTLLVSGTAIGAGMLALPVATGLSGFYPSLLLFFFFWAFMTYTALLVLEVNLWMDSRQANFISMAKQTLGISGEFLSWIAYLFLLYALLTAYIAGCGFIFLNVLYSWTGILLPPSFGAFPLLLIFGYFVYRGTDSVDFLNRILMMALVVVYGCIIAYLTPHVDHEKFERVEWTPLLSAVSIVAASFGYHIIIPSLTSYMNRNISGLKWAILLGSFMSFTVYIVWEYLTLGIIPVGGESGIFEAQSKGLDGAHLVSSLIEGPLIAIGLKVFSFFAIVTSFLGVSISLKDFLADGFNIEKRGRGRFLLFVMTFVPPVVITFLDPRVFLSALEYGGAFGVMVLLGLVPALMVWSGRYYHHYYSPYKTPGGKIGLVVTMIISLAAIGLEIMNKSGFLPL